MKRLSPQILRPVAVTTSVLVAMTSAMMLASCGSDGEGATDGPSDAAASDVTAADVGISDAAIFDASGDHVINHPSVPDASSDAALDVDAKPSADADAGAFDADANDDADGEAPTCSADLSGVGTGDFFLSLTLATTQTGLVAVASQRPDCNVGSSWWSLVVLDGAIEPELDDDQNEYEHFSSTSLVNDGALHRVEVARVSGTLTVTIDGVASGSIASTASLDRLAPLRVGTSLCDGIGGTQPFHGTILDFCANAPGDAP